MEESVDSIKLRRLCSVSIWILAGVMVGVGLICYGLGARTSTKNIFGMVCVTIVAIYFLALNWYVKTNHFKKYNSRLKGNLSKYLTIFAGVIGWGLFIPWLNMD